MANAVPRQKRRYEVKLNSAIIAENLRESQLFRFYELTNYVRSAHLTNDDRSYLQRVSRLDWFGAQVAAVLLQIEAKVKASGGLAV